MTLIRAFLLPPPLGRAGEGLHAFSSENYRYAHLPNGKSGASATCWRSGIAARCANRTDRRIACRYRWRYVCLHRSARHHRRRIGNGADWRQTRCPNGRQHRARRCDRGWLPNGDYWRIMLEGLSDVMRVVAISFAVWL